MSGNTKQNIAPVDDGIPDGGTRHTSADDERERLIDSFFRNKSGSSRSGGYITSCGRHMDYSMLIQNPEGRSALLDYIDVERMIGDPRYRLLVYQGMMNPTWDGVILPDGLLSWRTLAECMKKDRFPTAPQVEQIADMTEIAGTRCPLMRLPIPGRPGYVFTVKNPRYKNDSAYQKLEDHILADYGMILLSVFKDSVRKGKIEKNRTIRETAGLEAARISFGNFFFHRTGKTDVIQGDVIIRADLKQDLEDVVTEYRNVQLRMEIEYHAVENKLAIDPKIYTSYYGSRSQGRLINQHLLPVLRNDWDCEREAESFLAEFFPEGLGDEPVPFDAKIVAGKLKASLHRSDLSDKVNRVYGLCYPESRKGTVIDNYGVSHETELPDNSILYDYRIEDDEVKLSDTITHEILHVYKDRPFYFLQKHFGHQISCFCYSPGKKYDRDALGQAERQVSRLVPRVKMPRKQFIKKANDLIVDNLKKGYTDTGAYEQAIGQLAAFFKVSKESARIRMTETGFEQARGVSRYVDGRYIPAFSWTPGSIGRDQTFTISFSEGLTEYGRNPSFRGLVSSGAFVYVDAHYCLNDRRYVYRDRNGRLQMTEEARRNMDKCCLVFDVRYTTRPAQYTHGVFFNEARKSRRSAELDESAKAIVASFGKGLDEAISRRPALSGTYSGRLLQYREQKGYSLEKMEELTGISYKTIERYEINRNANKSEAYMVAICIALELPPSEAYDLLDLAGLRLRDSEFHAIFAFAIDCSTSYTLGEINWLLTQNKQKPLTKLITPIETRPGRRAC